MTRKVEYILVQSFIRNIQLFEYNPPEKNHPQTPEKNIYHMGLFLPPQRQISF